MKRLFTVALATLLCACLLVSCKDDLFVKYDEDEIGLHYELPASLEYYQYGERGTYKTYRNTEKSVAVVISYLKNADLAASDAPYGQDVTLEVFLDHFITSNELGIDDVEYNDDKTRATFDLVVADEVSQLGQYYYYTMIRGNGGIYVVQMLCADGLTETYVPQFIRWSNLIYAY